jgi:hypothetical protein
MLRKVVWTVLLAIASLAARRAAAQLYRIVTGEPPPVKRG